MDGLRWFLSARVFFPRGKRLSNRTVEKLQSLSVRLKYSSNIPMKGLFRVTTASVMGGTRPIWTTLSYCVTVVSIHRQKHISKNNIQDITRVTKRSRPPCLRRLLYTLAGRYGEIFPSRSSAKTGEREKEKKTPRNRGPGGLIHHQHPLPADSRRSITASGLGWAGTGLASRLTYISFFVARGRRPDSLVQEGEMLCDVVLRRPLSSSSSSYRRITHTRTFMATSAHPSLLNSRDKR